MLMRGAGAFRTVRGMETLEPGPDPADAEPLVEVTRIAKNRWQASFPEDVDELLGDAYDDLEDVLGAVAGVTNAFMEDRDLAIVDTRAGVTGEDLERNLAHALSGMLRQ